LMSFS